jgi:predicted nucleic acid-binding protein
VSAFDAVLDACVLIPAAVCDTLLRAAQRDLYRPYWSALILAEVERNLVASGLIADPAKARQRVNAMRGAFERANVTGFEALIPSMPNHPQDRHVLAAAVVAGAEVVVTYNLRDFRTAGIPQARITAQHPDAFLTDLFEFYPDDLIAILAAQAAALRTGGQPWTIVDVLERLERADINNLPACVRDYLAHGVALP